MSDGSKGQSKVSAKLSQTDNIILMSDLSKSNAFKFETNMFK